MKKKLYLVDASAMFFRAFYAIRPLTNSQGMPTNAIYGFLSMTIKLLKESRPDYIAYCFDLPTPSFRKNIFPEYKANRSDTPEDLIPQIPYMKSLPTLLGLPAFEKNEFEADDLIGSLSHFGKKNKLEVIIVSGDKDFAQLVDEDIKIFDPMKNLTLDAEGVKAKWGVTPSQFIDYLAITGDSSDNIPGVKGLGPKGAQNLLNEYKNLEDIYIHIEDIKNKGAKQKLIDSQSNALLSKKLVTIVTDIKIVDTVDELKPKEADIPALIKVLDELNFETFKKNFLTQNANNTTSSAVESSNNTLLESKSFNVVDQNELMDKLDIDDFVWVIQHLEKNYLMKENFLAELLNIDDFKKSVEHKLISIKGYDVKKIFRKFNFHCEVKWDQRIAAYVLKAGNINDFATLSLEYLNTAITESISLEDLANINLQLEDKLKNELQNKKLDQILETIEIPLIEVLYEMENRGVLLDTKYLSEESKLLADDILKLEKEIYKLADGEFNIASPKQLGQVLFEKLMLPTDKKTKTGYSTDSDVLEKLRTLHPICQFVIDFRELSKLKSTYVDSLPQLVDATTHRLHTDFNQALTTTGRLSSVNPNLQNIPIRTERGLRVRRAFIAEQGNLLVSADYSQIELRVLAHITDDPQLLKFFKEDLDIHAKTASEVFEVPLDKVTSEQRRQAKAVNFGIAYGQGPYGLAENLGISRTEAKDIINRYFTRFPGVKKYMEDIVRLAYENGYVETLIGRRRYLPEIHSKNHAVKSFGERAAINAPIQGTASDIVKMAMLEVHHEFKGKMLIQVHDELLFELPEVNIDANMKKIKSIMENCIQLKVSLKINIDSGKNWQEAH